MSNTGIGLPSPNQNFTPDMPPEPNVSLSCFAVVALTRPRNRNTCAESIFAFAERRWGQGTAAAHFRGLRNVLHEFGARVWEEMDFRREAEYAQAMGANFAGRAGVKVPYVVPSLVRHRALVLEYMPGVRIDRLQDRVRAGTLDAAELVRRVIELYMHMMLRSGAIASRKRAGFVLLFDDVGASAVLE